MPSPINPIEQIESPIRLPQPPLEITFKPSDIRPPYKPELPGEAIQLAHPVQPPLASPPAPPVEPLSKPIQYPPIEPPLIPPLKHPIEPPLIPPLKHPIAPPLRPPLKHPDWASARASDCASAEYRRSSTRLSHR